MAKFVPVVSFRSRLLAGVAAGVIGIAPVAASAADVTWLGGAGLWSIGTNWIGGSAPLAGDNVFIDGGNPTNSVATLNIVASIGNLTISGGDVLAISNNTALTMSGNLSNAGTLQLNSAGNVTDLVIGASTTFSGAGSVTLSNNPNNRIYGSALNNVLTNQAGHTIQGAGQLGVNQMSLINAGLIDANVSNALTVDLGGDATTNSNTGTMRASSGGTLNITGTALTNTGGTIAALGTSDVNIVGGSAILGGTLTTTGSGVINVGGGSTLQNITNSGAIQIGNNQAANLAGTIANSGTIALQSVGNLTDLIIQGDVTLTGTGTVTLSNNPSNRIYGAAVTNLLTNEVGHTIQGSGQLGNNQMRLDNRGLIDANVSNTLTVDLSGDATTNSNTGTMRASSGGQLNITGTGLTNTGGTIEALDASRVDLAVASRITGGTVQTSGTGIVVLSGNTVLDTLSTNGDIRIANNTEGRLAGTITNSGTIALQSVGNLTNLRIEGDVTLTGPGSMAMSNNASNQILGLAADDVLTNTASHTIRGAGRIGVNSMGLDNQGLIDATQSNALTVDLVNTAGVTRSNTGTMRASSGGTLTITDTDLASSGGTIEALDASTVNLIGASRITGGTVQTSGTGRVFLSGNTALDTLSTDGDIRIENNTQAYVAGTITNSGTISLLSVGNVTNLRIEGDVTLTGPGSVTMSNNANNQILGLAATDVLTNTASHAIRGAGRIGVNAMGLDNQGLIDATLSNDLTVDLVNTAGVTRSNTGTMRASSGGTLTINDTALANSGGTIEALDASTLNLIGASRLTGGTVQTSGTGRVFLSGNTVLDTLSADGDIRITNNTEGRIAGTISNSGTIALQSVGNATTLRIEGDVTLTGPGSVTMSNNLGNQILGLAATDVLTNAAGHTIRGSGQLGNNQMGLVNAGLIDANQSNVLVINPTDALTVLNTGTLRGSGSGGLTLTGGTFDNQGVVEALNGSNVTYTNTAVTANNLAGTLTGGIWRAESTGSGATIALRGDHVSTNAADIYLSGAGSVVQVTNASSVTASIDTTLHTNDGALRLQNGRVFNATANSGNFTNNGILELTDSTFTSNTLASNGAVLSFGNSTLTTAPGSQTTGTGSISSSFGTLTITRGVNMGTGSSMTSNPGGAIDLSSATQASRIGTLNNNGALALGTQNLVVTKDYTNANFGVGNAFDRRANVSGAGQIIGENAAMTITGAVTPSGANTVTLNLGNVRGGTSITVNYQAANTGTGADIRGAVQTAANGGNITDARLSGSGVTAQNFGPVAAGGNTGNLAVTFNATSGGCSPASRSRW